MNEKKFKNLEDIENYKIRFKCFTDDRDGYQATFHIYDKSNSEIHYRIDFGISGSAYCSDVQNVGKSTMDYIIEKYGDIENCFKKIGVEYLKEKISRGEVKDDKLSLIKYLF